MRGTTSSLVRLGSLPLSLSGDGRSRWISSRGLLLLAGLAFVRLLSDREQPVVVVFRQPLVAVERVIDGDTLLLASGHRVRLIGVDTPETKHPDRGVEWLGPEASRFTAELVGRSPVRLEFDRERRDPYHRLLAYVFLPDGRLLNAEIIRAGFSEAETAFPYRSDRKRQFTDLEAIARAERRGRWAADDLTGEPGPNRQVHRGITR
jgi:micrococcal nuclease